MLFFAFRKFAEAVFAQVLFVCALVRKMRSEVRVAS